MSGIVFDKRLTKFLHLSNSTGIASLISISREEMWHFHWLEMIIGKLGDEPNFTPAQYPYDPTSGTTILRSYIEYEEKLIPHYGGEAEKVDDPHIRLVLEREARKSATHAINLDLTYPCSSP